MNNSAFPSFDQTEAAFAFPSDQSVSSVFTVGNAAVTRLTLGKRHTLNLVEIGERDEYWWFWLKEGPNNPTEYLSLKLLAIADATPNIAAMTPDGTQKALIIENCGLAFGVRITRDKPDLAVWWGVSGGAVTSALYCTRGTPYNPTPNP